MSHALNSSLKLGTRRSRLAMAQTRWVARELQRNHPEIDLAVVGMETQGDRITDIPLSKIEGKEFFVTELDQALIRGEVDLTVHSLKDLSLKRPEEIYSVVTPSRKNPRDVVLFRKDVIEKLSRGEVLKIGTSSPRRLENVPAFLGKVLPRFQSQNPNPQKPNQFVEIRGNVQTRMQRLFEPPGSAHSLDAVVLAFAGLIRLWEDPSGREALREFLPHLRWMVLPLDENPTAPGQGALRVECRKEDEFTKRLIQSLHHTDTFEAVSRERGILEGSGGGCHQRFGATSIHSPLFGSLLFIRGKTMDGNHLDELQWAAPENPRTDIRAWDGRHWRKKSISQSEPIPHQLPAGTKAVFLTHARACERMECGIRIWTSGVGSWVELAKKGIWVEGCAEGLGFHHLQPIIQEPVLGLPPLDRWKVLTHQAAVKNWKIPEAIGTYVVSPALPPEALASLKNATHLYWGSSEQFDQFGSLAPRNALHACGPGRTYEHLKGHGVKNLQAFPSLKEWKKWIHSNSSPTAG